MGVRKTKKGLALKRWLKEDWVRTDTGEPCGSGKSVDKSKKYCRPSKKISKDTPKTVSQLTKSGDLKKKEREKKRLSNKNKKPSRVTKAQGGTVLSYREYVDKNGPVSKTVYNQYVKNNPSEINQVIKTETIRSDKEKQDFLDNLKPGRYPIKEGTFELFKTEDGNIDIKATGKTDYSVDPISMAVLPTGLITKTILKKSPKIVKAISSIFDPTDLGFNIKKGALKIINPKKAQELQDYVDIVKVKDDFKLRVNSEEGKRRVSELGIDLDVLNKKLDNVQIKHELNDANAWGSYEGSQNLLHIDPKAPSEAKKFVTRHELEHLTQSSAGHSFLKDVIGEKTLKNMNTHLKNEGSPIDHLTKIDESLSDLTIKPKEQLGEGFDKIAEYIKTGSDGFEKAPHLANLQQFLIDKKYIKNPYDKVTPELLKQVNEDVKITSKAFEKGDLLGTSILKVMENTDSNYKLLADNLNKMLGITGVIGATQISENMNKEKSTPKRQLGGRLRKITKAKEGTKTDPPDKKEMIYPEDGDFIPDVVDSRLKELRQRGALKTSSCIGSACYVYNKNKGGLDFEGTRFPEDDTVYSNTELAANYDKIGFNRTNEPVQGAIIQFTKEAWDENKQQYIDNPYHAGIVKEVKEDGTFVVAHTQGGDNWVTNSYRRDPETGNIINLEKNTPTSANKVYFYDKDKVPENIHRRLYDNSDVSYKIDISDLEKSLGYEFADTGKEFVNALQDPIVMNKIREQTGMTLREYDNFAKLGVLTLAEETEGGSGVLYRTGIDDKFGDSKGLIQLNWDLHVESKDKDGNYINQQLRNKLKALNISKEDLMNDPKKQAMVFMLFAPLNQRYAESFYQKGLKVKEGATRTKTESIIDNRGLVGSSVGTVLNKVNKKIGLTTENTYPVSGNKEDLTDVEKFRYGYREPGALITGDAGGESISAKRFKEGYSKIRTYANDQKFTKWLGEQLKKQREAEEEEDLWKNALPIDSLQQGGALITSKDKSNLDIVISNMIEKIPAYRNFRKQDFYKMLDTIKHVETNNKNIDQKQGGPGQGYFQIEKTSLPTAKNRLRNLSKDLGFDISIDMSKQDTKEYDEETQAVFALANMHGAARRKKEYLPVRDVKTTWLNYHWAGPDDQRSAREKHFDEVVSNLKQDKSKEKMPNLIDKAKKKSSYDIPKPKDIPKSFTNVASDATRVQAPLFKKGGKLDKKKMSCNKPKRSPNPKKKKVVKACENGKEKIIHYGDSNYSDYTKHKDKKRRANFRARHNCKNAKSKLTAKYWACKDLW